MKILVTGGLGFIGHNVVRLLEQQGHTIGIIDNLTDYGMIPATELDYLIAERIAKIKTRNIYNCDISNELIVNRAFNEFKPELVIHLASFPRQKVVNVNPQWGSRTMSEGLLNLLELSVEYKIRKFVYISSSMVYGNFKDTYFDGIDESHDCNPIGQYGIMKLAGEWLVKDYQRRTNLNYTIIRPSAVYGPLDVNDRVISKFFLAAMNGEVINVNGSDEQLDFTYIDDISYGITQASLSDNTDNMIYNLTRGSAKTLLEAAKLVVDIVGKGSIQVNNRDTNFPSRGQLNNIRAYEDFGYAPEINIEEGFQQYYGWLINNPIYRIKETV